jgi:hypothetical protein
VLAVNDGAIALEAQIKQVGKNALEPIGLLGFFASPCGMGTPAGTGRGVSVLGKTHNLADAVFDCRSLGACQADLGTVPLRLHHSRNMIWERTKGSVIMPVKVRTITSP